MSLPEFTGRPIGVIHSPFASLEEMPIQPASRAAAPGTAEVFPGFQAGLKDLEGFSHIILLYWLHRAGPAKLQVTPFLDQAAHGVFATRAPARPNPIGLSIVALVSIEGGLLHIANLDILDGTPLLDIKPYVPQFDHPAGPHAIGWLQESVANLDSTRSDERFK